MDPREWTATHEPINWALPAFSYCVAGNLCALASSEQNGNRIFWIFGYRSYQSVFL